MLVITHRLGTGMSAAAQAQVVDVLNLSILVNQGDIAGNLQGSTIRDEHFSGYFQQVGFAPVLLAFPEPLMSPDRGRQVFLLLCTFRLGHLSGIVHECDKRITGFHTGFFGFLPNFECGGHR